MEFMVLCRAAAACQQGRSDLLDKVASELLNRVYSKEQIKAV
jgi:hypothetical protein